jgi:hypothetical protein
MPQLELSKMMKTTNYITSRFQRLSAQCLLISLSIFMVSCASGRGEIKADWLLQEPGWDVRDWDDNDQPDWVIYERDALIADVKELRIVALIDAPPSVAVEALWNRISDEARSNDDAEITVISESDTEITFYALASMPFPFNDREVTERIQLTHNVSTGVFRVYGAEVPQAKEPPKGVVRMPFVRNSFTLTPTGTGKSIYINDTLHDLGGNFPNWIIHLPVSKKLVEDVYKLKKATENANP